MRLTPLLFAFPFFVACTPTVRDRLLAPENTSKNEREMVASMCALFAQAPASSPIWKEKSAEKLKQLKGTFSEGAKSEFGDRPTRGFLKDGKALLDDKGNAISLSQPQDGNYSADTDFYVGCLLSFAGFRWDQYPPNSLSNRVGGYSADTAPSSIRSEVVVGDQKPAGIQSVPLPNNPAKPLGDGPVTIGEPLGLADAVSKGFLRKATSVDTKAWADAIRKEYPQHRTSDDQIPRFDGTLEPPLYNAYVVLRPFVYPRCLYGRNMAVFLIPKGVPMPEGNPGDSSVFDFNSLKCQGMGCIDPYTGRSDSRQRAVDLGEC